MRPDSSLLCGASTTAHLNAVAPEWYYLDVEMGWQVDQASSPTEESRAGKCQGLERPQSWKTR